MKKLFFILLVFSVLKFHAADIYVNNSGQAGTYTAIQTAINAAAPGDRIFVSPYGLYTENLTIAKSLTITSAVANTRYSVLGNVTVTSAPNQDVIIIGGEFSGDIVGNTGTATLVNKGFLTITDCKAGLFTTGNFIKTKLLYSNVTTTVDIRHGMICGSVLGNISITEGPNSAISDTTFLIGNITNGITWNNDDNFFFISNNFINGGTLTISRFQFNTTVKNLILNNTIKMGFSQSGGNCLRIIGFTNANLDNLFILNNLLEGTISNSDIGCGLATCNALTGSIKLLYNGFDGISGVPNSQLVGNWLNNSGTVSIDSLGRITSTNSINQGSPALQYYDIDLTRNDIGTFGGPYSIDNYWNTANGRARVYELNMPFEIWNGSTPSIKAEGIHIK
jgi:hypothetical protein